MAKRVGFGMDRRVVIGGGIIVAALAVVGIRSVMNTGAKTGLDAMLSHLPPGITVTHGDVTFNGLTGAAHIRDLGVARDGVPVFAAGDVAITGIGAADASGTPERIGEIVMHDVTGGGTTRIARIELTGLALANLRQVVDPAFYPGGKPAWTDKRPILEHGIANGIQLAQAGVADAKGQMTDVKVTVGTAGLDGLRVSQLPTPPTLDGDPAVALAALETHLAYDSNMARDTDFTVAGASPVHGHFGLIKAGAFNEGRDSDIAMADFSMSIAKPAGTVSVASVELHGFDMSKMLAMMPELAAAPRAPHPELFNGISLARGELSGMRIDFPVGPLVTMDTMAGVSAAGGAADKTSTFSIHGFTVQTSGRPLSASARQSLADFGMADFTTDLDEAGSYDKLAGTVTLKRCDIAVHDVGALHIAAVVMGLPPGSASTQQEVQARLAQARLASASFIWNDVSLVTRLLKMAAAKQGVTPEQVRAGLALPLASLPMMMPEQPDAAEQVNAFLDGRHMLKVTLTPPSPVGIAELKAAPPQEKAALLGVRITGN
jgi:hypothetical protein